MNSKKVRSDDDIEKAIKEFSGTVFKIAFSYTKSRQCSEDILQNVLIKYMTSSTLFRDEDHKKAWMIRVTVNECKKYYRSLKYRLKYEKMEPPGPVSTEKNDIYYALMKLPAKYRNVIHLYYYEQMPIKDISQVLSIKEGTVSSLLFRARKKLKEIMEVEIEN